MGDQPATELVPIGQVVAELRADYPDISHSSLRFLEREGLVSPARTGGGHRLYTRRDLDRIRQIKAWQTQRRSLNEIRRRFSELEASPAPAAVAATFLNQALLGDAAAASRTVLHADDLGMPLARLFDDVLRPALDEVGLRWARGHLLVGQEKEISDIARELIAILSLRHAHPDPTGPVAVAACVAGERHDLGLRMVTALLRSHGWRIHLLGVDTAPRVLGEAVRLRTPSVVLLSGSHEVELQAITDAIETVRTAGSPAIVVGGHIVTEHAATLRAHGAIPATGDRLDSVIDSLLTIMAGNRPDAPALP